ncbi:MazG nucleotide pyrophosphohydrolase domain-containing protein [Anaerophilus nitritogenes]|uniref:MazG nucleotide pyrophosphohydrolase domain-containing protein n=1 Tax=Anaerophilus nitritogenes TaxID=2498136 RepID=UPI00101C8D6A|nr:MazG nucleotide pyrophosphohydrolase domain-containing protein [Anaerophilus nitritogenes]
MIEQIFNYFGEANQIEKLKEEVEEFIQAVKNKDIDNMEEEIADIEVVLEQFARVFKLDKRKVKHIKRFKVQRTVNRIKRGYYKRWKNASI